RVRQRPRLPRASNSRERRSYSNDWRARECAFSVNSYSFSPATPMKILPTTSFQDPPGPHHDVLKASGFEVVTARGPLSEQQMLELIKANDGFDGLLNGDDKITAMVI